MSQATRHRSDHKTKNCTEPGCDRPLRARGRCVSHHNDFRYGPDRPRHVRVPTSCANCGKVTLKEPRKSSARRYCSYECRSAQITPATPKLKLVKLSCPVPATHPSRIVRKPSFFAGLCVECGGGYVIASACVSMSSYCSRTCARRVAKRARRAREHRASGTFTWDAFNRLSNELGKHCAYCRQDCTGIQLEPDHVVPLSRGGHNGLTNILPSCRRCNGRKSDLTIDQWDRRLQADGFPPLDLGRFPHLTAHVFLAA